MNWRRVATAGAVLVAVAAPLWGPPALRPMRFFAVRKVELSGCRYLAPAVVVEALGLADDASVFDDLDDLEARLLRVTGIERASVDRRIPGTLVVSVAEREPVALAMGPEGLVAVDEQGRPLPYDLTAAVVDAPVVRLADRELLAALGQIRANDLGLHAGVVAAWTRGGEVVLDLGEGRARLKLPVDPPVVRQVSAVQRDLAARGVAWRELDARFRGWVVVRTDAPARRRTAAPGS